MIGNSLEFLVSEQGMCVGSVAGGSSGQPEKASVGMYVKSGRHSHQGVTSPICSVNLRIISSSVVRRSDSPTVWDTRGDACTS